MTALIKVDADGSRMIFESGRLEKLSSDLGSGKCAKQSDYSEMLEKLIQSPCGTGLHSSRHCLKVFQHVLRHLFHAKGCMN
jgi:hypothetical protein